MLTKQEIVMRIETFIENWRNKKFPDLVIQYEKVTFSLRDIIGSEFKSAISGRDNTITFITDMIGLPDIRFSLNENSIKFNQDQPKLLEFLTLLENKLEEIK